MSDGSYRIGGTPGFAKLAFPLAPHSPLSERLVRSQSITRLLLRSVHGRVVLVTAATNIGFTADARPVATPSRYLPAFHLIAVRPFPNRSYDMPTRGEMSFQFGRSGIAAKVPAGAQRVA